MKKISVRYNNTVRLVIENGVRKKNQVSKNMVVMKYKENNVE